MIEDTDTVYCSGCHQDRPRAGHWFARQPSGATDAFCRECWPQFCARQCSVATGVHAARERARRLRTPVAHAGPKPIWERLGMTRDEWEAHPHRDEMGEQFAFLSNRAAMGAIMEDAPSARVDPRWLSKQLRIAGNRAMGLPDTDESMASRVAKDIRVMLASLTYSIDAVVG